MRRATSISGTYPHDLTRLDEHVAETLQLSGSKTRYYGVVEGVDAAGSTLFIVSGERRLLAFNDKTLKPGDYVSFRLDGQRAKDIRVEQPESEPQREPEPQQSEEPTTAMAAAFHRLFN